MPTPLRIGLTGGIACGKSQVLSRLARAGLHTLDLDEVAHEVMAPGGAAYEDVVAAFGPAILAPAGAIDRKALGGLVFRDEGARQRLNAIVHPRVWAEEARRVAGWSAEAGSVAVTDAALLIESGLHLRFDRLVVVHCPATIQLQRLMARDGIDEEAASSRLRAQMPIEEKRLFGHFRLETSGSLEQTWAASDDLAREIQALARRPRPVVALARDRALGCLQHGPDRGPRGLSPTGVLVEIAKGGGLAMEGLKTLLSPPSPSVWYRAARPEERGPTPATLAGALVLWHLSRGIADEEVLLAAMASLARLTHGGAAPAIGNACVLLLAMLDAVSPTPMVAARDERLALWRSKAERWAGGAFSDELSPVLTAVEAHPRDPGSARAAATSAGGDADLAGALSGLRHGNGGGPARRDAEDAVNAVLPLSGRPGTG
jgi:dephospho-CoA kinase